MPDTQLSTNSQAVVTASKPPALPKPPVSIGQRGVQLTNIDEMWRFAQAVSVSAFAPKGLEKAESVFIALQMGLELGLSPMAALQNIAVINGRPGIYGDAALACVRASGFLERYEEWYEVDGKPLRTGSEHPRNPTAEEVKNPTCTAYVLSQRQGQEAKVEGFSTGDAKLAGLWGKSGPWSQYPARMLKFRARGFNLRDNFGDVLKGFRTSEELQDDPEARAGLQSAKPVFGNAATVPAALFEAALPTTNLTTGGTEAEAEATGQGVADLPRGDSDADAPAAQPSVPPASPDNTSETEEETALQKLGRLMAEDGVSEGELTAYALGKRLLSRGMEIPQMTDARLESVLNNWERVKTEIVAARGGAK